MRGRRLGSISGAGALVAAALVVLATSPAEAAPILTPSATSVAVGGSITVDVGDCETDQSFDDGDEAYQFAQVSLVVGVGGTERMAAVGTSIDTDTVRIIVPGWVDPSEAAVIAGSCRLADFATGASTPVFTYPDVAVDVTAGPATGPLVTLSRTVAAAGQVIVVDGTDSGCEQGSVAQALVFPGTDLSYRSAPAPQGTAGAEVDGAGDFRIELALNDQEVYAEDGIGLDGAGPLPEGPYVLFVTCERVVGGDYVSVLAEPSIITVAGSFPSGDISVGAGTAADTLLVEGSGCVGGDVTVRFEGYGDVADRAAGETSRGWPGSAGAGGPGRFAVGGDGDFEQTFTVAPAADGSWSLVWDVPDGDWYEVVVQADCGDPAADGFRYVGQYWSEDNYVDVFVMWADPDRSPTGGTVNVRVAGECDGEITVQLQDRGGAVVAESAPVVLGPFLEEEFGPSGVGVITAPATAGTYTLAGACDGESGYGEPYEVFAATVTPPVVPGPGPAPAVPLPGHPAYTG